MNRRPGQEAVSTKGWLRAHKWLILRRLSQLGIIAIFLLGPLAGVWIVKGNLASSVTLEILPLNDPYLMLQSLATGHTPAADALIGAAIVTVFYFLVGGRVYCSWVCPVNMVTDGAAWMERRIEGRRPSGIPQATRYWLLGGTILLAGITGTIAWEWVNPVSLFHREVIFGIGLGWLVVLGILLFDSLISRRGWCGHLCPVGAFYGLLGFYSIPRVSAYRRSHCTDCADCFSVCPEPHVIGPALNGTDPESPVIRSINCINCGRCIDVCPHNVFRFTSRFNNHTEATS